MVERVVECHDCGLRQRQPHLPPGQAVECARCGAVLHRFTRDPLGRALAFAVTGLVLFVISISLPIMTMSIAGRVQQASLLTGIREFVDRGLGELALVVLLTTVVAPLFYLAAVFWTLLGLRMRRPPPDIPRVFLWVRRLRPWAMLEVFILGVFVAYVKLLDLASVEIDLALYAIAVLALIVLFTHQSLDSEAIWEAMERRGLVRPPLRAAGPGALLCEGCGALTEPLDGRCPRCATRLHRRKPNSYARTWALVLAAMVLYLPANIFPVMTVISFGSGSPSTILGGVQELLEGGMLPLALLVFFASITVPVLKLVCLILLLVTAQRGSTWRRRDRTRIYRLVEGVGRWSMIDIFMLSILIGLVRLGRIATIEPGIGAVSFASVVILTMFAANTFDPRLMWDAQRPARER